MLSFELRRVGEGHRAQNRNAAPTTLPLMAEVPRAPGEPGLGNSLVPVVGWPSFVPAQGTPQPPGAQCSYHCLAHFVCKWLPAATSKMQFKSPQWAGLCSHWLAAWSVRASALSWCADSTALGLGTGGLGGGVLRQGGDSLCSGLTCSLGLRKSSSQGFAAPYSCVFLMFS